MDFLLIGNPGIAVLEIDHAISLPSLDGMSMVPFLIVDHCNWMTPSRRSPLLRISRLVDNQSESKQKGFLTIRRVSLILYENPKQIIVGGDFVMPRLTFKETVTKEIEIPLDKLFAIIDQLSSDDLFESNPSHPSLNTELLEPKHLLIYSLRIDLKHRALFICHPNLLS